MTVARFKKFVKQITEEGAKPGAKGGAPGPAGGKAGAKPPPQPKLVALHIRDDVRWPWHPVLTAPWHPTPVLSSAHGDCAASIACNRGEIIRHPEVPAVHDST